MGILENTEKHMDAILHWFLHTVFVLKQVFSLCLAKLNILSLNIFLYQPSAYFLITSFPVDLNYYYFSPNVLQGPNISCCTKRNQTLVFFFPDGVHKPESNVINKGFSSFKAGRWACCWPGSPCTVKTGGPARCTRCRAPSPARLTAACWPRLRRGGGWLSPSHSLRVGEESYWMFPKRPG